MKKIVVPTDFSPCAANAINFAIQSSRIFSIDITIIHVMELMNSVYNDYTGFTVDYSALLREEVEERLKALKERIQIEENILINTSIYEPPVGSGIVQAGIDHSADLIIMGTMGANGLKEKLWGSHTGAVIEKSNVPVMVVPDQYQWRKPKKILLASSNFEQDRSLLNPLMDLVKFYNASLRIVVFTDHNKDSALTVFEHAYKIRSYKDFIIQVYNHVAIADHIYGNNLSETLEEYIDTNEIDLLVMITHKRKLFERLFHPSLTKRMSFHTHIPLLAIPA